MKNDGAAMKDALITIVGASGVLTDPAEMAPYLSDWRGRYRGRAQAVVFPNNTEAVAALVRLCTARSCPIVPQGGNTGLCGGATPDGSGRAVLVNLSRLRRIRTVDAENNTILVEAGCTLAEVQAAAADAGRLFPLSLASEGSCQIGGNLSTNAGGVQVLRYGTMRELTLGLEVVLANGEIWNGLRALRKDNTGYDLKSLFLGAEGTLGLITAAVLKLFPLPAHKTTCWLNISSPAMAVSLLNEAKAAFDAQLTAFELVSNAALELVLTHIPDCQRPAEGALWYVLAEFSDAAPAEVETWLSEMLEAELLENAVLAQSTVQAKKLWRLRESISEAQRCEGVSIKHDIAVPVSRLATCLERADAALEAAFPGVRIITFGHVGDGNLHYNLSKPDASDNASFLAQQDQVNQLVHDTVDALDGTISAEHGIGQLKRDLLPRYKSATELAMMRSIKAALDPQGLMNPGKVLPGAELPGA